MKADLSTRRAFLQKGLTLLAVAPTIPKFIDQTVLALNNPQDTPLTQVPNGRDGKILVVIQLSGGNDGLSTVIPYGDDHYYRLRPAIAEDAKTVLKIDNYIGLQQSLAPLKKIYDDGEMSVVQGVGYPNPNRSHFRSMDIWQSAQPEREAPTSGWLGRYFDNTCPGCDPHAGVAMGDQLPLAMQGERITPLSFERPENYRYRGPDMEHYLALNQSDAAANAGANINGGANANGNNAFAARPAQLLRPNAKAIEITPASQLDFLHRTAMDAQLSSDEILRITRGKMNGVGYPANEFGNSLRTVSAMISGGLPTRVYYVSLGGFDTHAGQKYRHDDLMKQLANGIGAFWADIKQQGNSDRVLMMTFSEFGRRVQQNASNGTDHGAASCMFLIGSKVKQGVVGQHPSLTALDQGDLGHNIDFRSVYASVLQNWLQTPSKPILGEQFATFPVVNA